MQKDAPQIDPIYNSYGKDLYKITGEEQEDQIMNMLQATPTGSNAAGSSASGGGNAGGVTIPADSIDSGVSASATVQAAGAASRQGKTIFTNTEIGYILGFDPSDGYAKFYIGNTTQYLNWTGTSLIIKGSISASSIDIPDTATSASFHVDSSGNTWWGATTLAGALASVTSNGQATFAGIFTLNMKLYTCFEDVSSVGATTRFISNTGGSGAVGGTSQGVTIEATAAGAGFGRLRWSYGNGSTLPTASIQFFLTGAWNSALGDTCSIYLGLGNVSVSTSAHDFTNSHIGFKILITAGARALYATVATGGTETATFLTNVSDTGSDVVDLALKVNSDNTAVDFYYRKIRLASTTVPAWTKATVTTNIPSTLTAIVSLSTCNDNNSLNVTSEIFNMGLER